MLTIAFECAVIHVFSQKKSRKTQDNIDASSPTDAKLSSQISRTQDNIHPSSATDANLSSQINNYQMFDNGGIDDDAVIEDDLGKLVFIIQKIHKNIH